MAGRLTPARRLSSASNWGCPGRPSPAWRAVIPVLMPGLPPDVARDGVLHDWTSYRGNLQNVVLDHRVQPAAARLARSGMSVRLIHGGRDEQAPLATPRELAEHCRWPLTVRPDATHGLPLEAPDVCAGVLRALLAGSGYRVGRDAEASAPPR